MEEQVDLNSITVGVVGLGLMGSSIAVALLLSGHTVVGIAPVEGEDRTASAHIKDQIQYCYESGLLKKAQEAYLKALTISREYWELDDCDLVLECVTEQLEIKKAVYKKIAASVRKDTIIATNTSAIPISELQCFIPHPERFIGIHWAEPAFATRFMEITSGEKTAEEIANWVYVLAYKWGKEPTLLKKDIKGFITNRLMYAVCREALSLIENRQATMEDVDKAFRYDAGSWMTLMGIFRRMDFLGLEDFSEIFKRIFPLLSNKEEVPEIMQRLVKMKAKGIQDCNGLYHYNKEEAKQWEKDFATFNKEIYQLAAQYPSVSEKPLLKEKPQAFYQS